MELKDILARVDHTELSVTASESEIDRLCDDALRFGVASVCVAPCHVRRAAERLCGRIAVCTVVGFPNGYSSPEVKAFETETAVRDGADEIDVVINIGALLEGREAAVLDELRLVREACRGRILKVIIETCKLTEAAKIAACRIVAQSGADFIKTSTGFGGGGATPEDVALLRRECPASVKVKAAGGIASLADAQRLISLGADRLGTSRLVRIAKQEKTNGGY